MRTEKEIKKRYLLLRGLAENADEYPSEANNQNKPFWENSAGMLQWVLEDSEDKSKVKIGEDIS